VAERWLPAEVAWRRKAMFRTPRDGFHQASPRQPAFVEQLLSRSALKKTGYFDAEAVHYWRQAYQQMRPRSQPRVMIEMGLVGVIATQLWHHTFIDSSLADLPAWSPASTTMLPRAA
jgi:asparagine synthase (glutamine-hydrolysing)